MNVGIKIGAPSLGKVSAFFTKHENSHDAEDEKDSNHSKPVPPFIVNVYIILPQYLLAILFFNLQLSNETH
jgi:hypothetical protein